MIELCFSVGEEGGRQWCVCVCGWVWVCGCVGGCVCGCVCVGGEMRDRGCYVIGDK